MREGHFIQSGETGSFSTRKRKKKKVLAISADQLWAKGKVGGNTKESLFWIQSSFYILFDHHQITEKLSSQ